MGKTRITRRTLPGGEHVLHHPPDDEHPEGKMVLCTPETNGLQQHFDCCRDDNQAKMDALRQAHQASVAALREAHDKGGVPGSKRCV